MDPSPTKAAATIIDAALARNTLELDRICEIIGVEQPQLFRLRKGVATCSAKHRAKILSRWRDLGLSSKEYNELSQCWPEAARATMTEFEILTTGMWKFSLASQLSMHRRWNQTVAPDICFTAESVRDDDEALAAINNTTTTFGIVAEPDGYSYDLRGIKHILTLAKVEMGFNERCMVLTRSDSLHAWMSLHEALQHEIDRRAQREKQVFGRDYYLDLRPTVTERLLIQANLRR
jgi:hypothetical protein